MYLTSPCRPLRRSWSWLLSLFFILAVAPALLVAGEKSQDGIWEDPADLATKPSGAPFTRPEVYQVIKIDRAMLANSLADAPMQDTAAAAGTETVMTLPMPGGVYARFEVEESAIMAPALAAKFPEIKTYAGRGLDDPSLSARIDVSPQGFHAQILSPKGAVYIDPFTPGDTEFCICYQKKDLKGGGQGGSCLVPDSLSARQLFQRAGGVAARSGTQLRTYRLAVATTGEYTAFHGGTVALGMAAVVTAINRVTGIYEIEFSIRFELVPNNDLLIYTNAATDPYTNNNLVALLSENQVNVDSLIGTPFYDVGHVFCTGGGGVASLGVAGFDGLKARGATGLPLPTGDVFYVDFVSHELGHQFDANHTFNGDSGNCLGNRNDSTAYEPGSGSTIMAYSGTCGNDNLQVDADAQMHSVSFDEVINHVDVTISPVGFRTATGNSIPIVDAGNDYTIPASTPFVLTAVGSDGNSGDVLSYSWEERDLGPQQDVSAGDNGLSPIFRVWAHTINPERTFPRLSDLVNNTTVIGETLPTTTRTLNFRVTVRDNRSGGGGVNTDDAVISVVNTGAPFRVTSPNTAASWFGTTTETVTWNVAGTTANGINASQVDILLSLDGGLTYPVVVEAATPNDGSAVITVPNMPTTMARIRVQGTGGIFFDISDVDFTITEQDFFFGLTPSSQDICPPDNVVVSINVMPVSGFTGMVTMSASGNPAGTAVGFSPNPVAVGGTTSMTVSGTGAAAAGIYMIDVMGVSGVVNSMDTATFSIAGGPAEAPELLSPANGAEGVLPHPLLLTWQSIPGVTSYEAEVDDDPAFGSPEFMVVTPDSEALVTPGLLFGAPYYWRVTAQSGCGTAVSSTRYFTTGDSMVLAAVCRNPSLAIPDNDPTGISATIFRDLGAALVDLDVSLDVTHTRVGDLIITLEHLETGTTVTLMNQPNSGNCNGNNFDIIVDDEAALAIATNCSNGTPAYATGVRYRPNGLLSDFNGEPLVGAWKLRVSDNKSGDIGTLDNWCLRPTVIGALPAIPTLTIADAEVDETAGSVMLTGVLSATSSDPIQVGYTTVNGSAEAGLDYTMTSGTLMIPAGQPSGPISVPILDDVAFEGTETFTVVLSNPVNVIVPDNEVTVSITRADTVFQQWLASYSLSGMAADPCADDDRDGVKIIKEFGFNLNPTQADNESYDPMAAVGPGGPRGVPIFEITGSDASRRLRVTYIRRKASSGAMIDYEVRFGGGLVGTVDGTEVMVTSIDGSWEEVIVDDPVNYGGSAPDHRRFASVRLVLEP